MYNYSLVINGITKTAPLTFDYGNTKSVNLCVAKQKVFIEKSLSKDYRKGFQDSYLDYLMREGVKRAALIHLIKYSEALVIKSMRLTIEDDKGVATITEDKYELSPLINGKLIRRVPSLWNDRVILRSIVKNHKSKMESEEAAVYGYLLGRSKANETERFLNNWIAFNGYYNSYYLIKNNKKSFKDSVKINFFLQDLPGSARILKPDDRPELAQKVMGLLCRYPAPITKTDLEQHVYPDFEDTLLRWLEVYSSSLSIYLYLLTDFSYYLRCSLFHGGKPLPLFCYKDDKELKGLMTANAILEDFLDNNLHKLFDGSIKAIEEE